MTKISMFFAFFARHKLPLFTCLFTLLIILLAFCIGFGAVGDFSKYIIPLHAWIYQHKLPFFLWHFAIIAAIYIGWGIKIDRAAKNHHLSDEAARKFKNFRWWLIAAVLFIDFMVL